MFCMSRDTRELTFGVSYQVRQNRAVLPHEVARGLKFRILKVEGVYYLCSEKIKAPISHAVTIQQICAPDFAYVKTWLSYDMARIICEQ